MTDKAWLKEELLRDLMRFNGNPNMTDYELGIASGIGTAINLTEKLEEQELTQRQVDKWLDKRDMVAVDAMMVCQTGMQNKVVVEKPIIPQFVAEWFENDKRDMEIEDVFWQIENCEMVKLDVDRWISDNRNTFIRAWLDGYEVEKEKRYQVKIPITVWDDDASELKEHTLFLTYDITSGETRILSPTPRRGDFRTDLTEAEIKAIDKRYWAFAEEVTK